MKKKQHGYSLEAHWQHMFLRKNKKKISQNYHQVLLLNNSSEYFSYFFTRTCCIELECLAQLLIGLDKGGYPVIIFLISPRKTYVVGTH